MFLHPYYASRLHAYKRVYQDTYILDESLTTLTTSSPTGTTQTISKTSTFPFLVGIHPTTPHRQHNPPAPQPAQTPQPIHSTHHLTSFDFINAPTTPCTLSMPTLLALQKTISESWADST